MPSGQLLDLLNDRLVADLGEVATRFTVDQLQAEIATQVAAEPLTDWPGMRKKLNQARKDGLLDAITTQVINDFAVVYQLTPQQASRVKEIIASAKANGDAP